MSAKFQAPKGTFDLLPGVEAIRGRIEASARDLFRRAGYGRIETPAFEDAELFARGVGEATDIVRKEMFAFQDAGGRSLVLRPEGTAPICRAYAEHGMHRLGQPVKLWYQGPFFRQEKPQAGRHRQFTQIGAEAIGSDSPLVDAESILLLDELLRGLGVPGLRLRLSSLGSPETRAEYRRELQDYLRAHEGDLSPEVRERVELNPLRAFDSDDEGTRAVMAAAPKLLDRLDGADTEHFAQVRGLLDTAGVAYDLDGTLVRGLDYYTRTVFEYECDRLGAQSGIGGGGRYDGLVEALGGPPAPGVGWAAGIERIVLALGAAEQRQNGEGEEGPAIDAFVVAPGDDRAPAFALVTELRRAGLAADLDLAGRGLKGQLKHADRLGARHTVFLGEDGSAELKDMASGEQRPIELDRLAEEITQ